MTDLFIVFYEIGLKMLNKNGILAYITPSSLFNSLACKDMRKYFVNNRLIRKVVDLKHNQVFENATTYTTIMVLSNKNSKDVVEYYEYNFEQNQLLNIDELSYDSFYINNNFYFMKSSELNHLKHIITYKSSSEEIDVKNGFATLNDKFFIGKFNFKDFVIPVVKASTGEEKQCIFPYQNGSLVPYDVLTQNKKLKKYYEENKKSLMSRSIEKGSQWYAFGRSQAIKDVYKTKYAISSIIKDIDSIKLVKCPIGVGIYGGLYILTNMQESIIKKIIFNQEFLDYVKMLGKYKSGGYYTYSSSDLRKYLLYNLKK